MRKLRSRDFERLVDLLLNDILSIMQNKMVVVVVVATTWRCSLLVFRVIIRHRDYGLFEVQINGFTNIKMVIQSHLPDLDCIVSYKSTTTLANLCK